MNRRLILLSILPAMLSTSCGGGPTSSLSREIKILSSSVNDSSTSSAKEGHLVSDLKEGEYKDFPKYFLEKLNSYKTYKTVTEGSTRAIIVTQPINAMVIKGEYSYMSNVSESAFAHTNHSAYYHNDKAIAKDYGEEEYTKYSLYDYVQKYGFYPFYPNTIEGYDVSVENILNISITLRNKKYVVEMELDTEKSTTNVRVQMQQFGGLKDYPSFSSVKLTLKVNDDYTPNTIKVNAEYVANTGISASCSQEYTVTFSNFDEEIEVPNLEQVKSLLE